MNGTVALLRPVLAGGLVVALLVWALALFARPPVTPEPAAVGGAADPTATATVTPTDTPEPTATPEPTGDALDNLVEVDLQGTETHAHPQVNGSRFNLTLEQAQEQISLPLRVPTLLPDGFVFVGADVNDGSVTQIFALEGFSPSSILTFSQRQGPISIPGRDDQQNTPGVTLEPVEGVGDDGLYFVDEQRGVSALSWTEGDMAYNLQVSGAVWSLERLQALAQSLRP